MKKYIAICFVMTCVTMLKASQFQPITPDTGSKVESVKKVGLLSVAFQLEKEKESFRSMCSSPKDLAKSYLQGEERLSPQDVMQLAQSSPCPAEFCNDFNKTLRENSPVVQLWKRAMSSPYVSPEVYEKYQQKIEKYIHN